jgi:four helix bundle protein
MNIGYKENLRNQMDQFVHAVYQETKKFPKEERFGASSQLRRAALSIVLNYTEGYARGKRGVQLNFYEIAYGSLKESMYLLNFSFEETFLEEIEYRHLLAVADEIGAQLWTEIASIKRSQIIKT